MRRLSLLALLWAVPCLAGAIAGRVFLDGNADGLWQATDTPCPGVLVSERVRISSRWISGLKTSRATLWV